MGSLGGSEKQRKAMWLYPKVLGFNPSERWGHSACYSDGVLYVFGGCCGGLHFSDVLRLDLESMAWSSLATTGQKPGARDSHSASIVGHKMVVLGGTNGLKKVNDLHILDLRTKEWTRPICEGNPPSPRESHTTTVMGEDKLVIFGGSGEGEGNYLNDVHVLDLKTMTWSSPEVNGVLPAPRDSHTAVAVENRLIIYGGDCGDRYHGEVDVLDMDTMSWSRLAVHGSLPGVRAGHAAVNIGTKVYVIGGVGDKNYYNDVWILDVHTCSWTQLDIRGQPPQGRFSHSAVVTDSDIAIYGGCGEDERPLNELLILQLGAEHPNGRYNISLCKIFGNHWSQESRKRSRGAENSPMESKNSLIYDKMQCKKRKPIDPKLWEAVSEQEEHSLSLSQHSSPSQSDQNTTRKRSPPATESTVPSHAFGPFKSHNPTAQQCQPSELPRQMKPKQFIRSMPASEPKSPTQGSPLPTMIGAEVRGTVDGAFDSGLLITANINGQILRGVLFSPGPGFVARAAAGVPQSPIMVAQHHPCRGPLSPVYIRPIHQQQMAFMVPESGAQARQQPHAAPVIKANPALVKPVGANSDLQGVVLTLGGP
ncbi:Acyl-CoA-binding domain-containing protein 4 [Acorus calamus]|uniref:Acyl-CoA-binding domain-containing protein 4 n=1 Tax=Acorus calamus TaxID=4465 RepID=A0AAV9F519_ACOCL|nr:Acyl-CoA-binding domain-containing protein 4 [Acorus calamus]